MSLSAAARARLRVPPLMPLLSLVLFSLLSAVARAGDPPPEALQAFVLQLGEDATADPDGDRVAWLFTQACEAGHALSCRWEEWRDDAARAHGPAREACEGGDPLGCVVAGWTVPGRAPGILMVEAEPFFQQSCSAGYPRGCSELGGMRMLEGRHDAGLPLLERACVEGVGNACMQLGTHAEDLQEAVGYHLRGCVEVELPDAISCAHVAWAYKSGEGLEKNPDVAHGMFEVLCAEGYGHACNVLGHDLDSMQFKEPDDAARAAGRYEQACDLGHEWGCANLGKVLVEGARGEREVARGRGLLRAACHEERKGSSCWQLSRLRAADAAQVGSMAPALESARLACRGRHESACLWEGAAHWAGLISGTPDADGARAAWERSCENRWAGSACLAAAHLDRAEGRDPTVHLEAACEQEQDLACELLEPDGPDPARGPMEVTAAPRAFHSQVSRNIAALAWGHQGVNACYFGLDDTCRVRLTVPLVGSGFDLDEADLRAWGPALEQTCAVGHAASCRALLTTTAEPGRVLEIATTGCVPGEHAEDLCRAARRVLDSPGRLGSQEHRQRASVALCLAGDGARCRTAVKGTVAPEVARGLVEAGCAADDAWSCRHLDKLR